MERVNSLRSLLEASYGVRTTERVNPVTGTVAVTATRIAQNNPRRVGLVVTNTGAASITISPDKSVSLTTGVILPANGSSISMSWDRDFELLSKEWYAIANGAPSSVYVLEIFILSNPLKGESEESV